MDDKITIEECISRLDVIRHEIVPNSRDHFALSAGISALLNMTSRTMTNCDHIRQMTDDGLVFHCAGSYYTYGEPKQIDKKWVDELTLQGYDVSKIKYSLKSGN